MHRQGNFAVITRNHLAALAGALLVLPTAALAAPGDDERGYLDIHASGITASGTAPDGTEDADKAGGEFGAALSYDIDSGPMLYGIDLSSTYYAYSDASREDRFSNRIGGNLGYRVSDDVTFAALADFTSHAATVESTKADQTRLRGQITVQPGPHRFRLTGGWRWRDYRDRPGESGDGPTVSAEYRYRLGKGHFFSVSAQYEEIDATLASRSYRRTTVSADYRVRLADPLSLSAGLTYKAWNYPGRAVGPDTQHDHIWTPELGLSWEFAKDWYAELDGKIIWRDSNNPGYTETIKRGMFTLRKRFRL